MKILIFGLGAVGQVLGGFLQKAGHDVSAVGRSKVTAAVNHSGIDISGIWGEHIIKLSRTCEDIKELPIEPFDLIILTIKSFDTHFAANAVKKFVGKKTIVICAQNGYGNYETASDILGKDHVLQARLLFGAESLEPGKVKISVFGDDILLGSPKHCIAKDHIKDIAKIFTEAEIPTRYTEDIEAYLWAKILYNCALNPLSAILETHYGALGEDQNFMAVMEGVILEIFNVADAYNIPMLWDTPASYTRFFYEKLLPPTAAHHASMLQDIKKGRPTEIDALNGAMVRLGEKKGIDVSINRTLMWIIRGKEKMPRI